MSDMNAFEKKLPAGFNGLMGPSEPVDDAAIFSAVSATQSARWGFGSMFSATKFAAAGAIVALFGGLLLTGLLTQPSEEQPPIMGASAPAQAEPTDALTASPDASVDVEPVDTSATPDLLPGVDLVTEEVEPGVFRVLSDDAGHDLVAEPPADVTVAPDGSVWLLRMMEEDPRHPYKSQVDAIIQLGQEGTHPIEPAREWWSDFAVDVDGGAWVTTGAGLDGASLGTFDGSTWMAPTWPDGSAGVAAIEATSDGAVWVTQSVDDGPGPRVARIVDGEWTELPALEDPPLAGDYFGSSKYFAAAADGTAWIANGNHHHGDFYEVDPPHRGLLHFDGTGWQVVELPVDAAWQGGGEPPSDDRSPWRAGPLALGSDGTLWVYLEHITQERLTCAKSGYLARLRDGDWSLFKHGLDGVPTLVCGQGPEAGMAVDGDGRLWVAGPLEDGVRSFDGTTWQHYLADMNVNRVSAMPDGGVVATALYDCVSDCGLVNEEIDWSRAGLYVIAPEAVAATE